MKFFLKLVFMFVLVLASVFAASFSDKIVMDKNDFDVQLYNCGSDSTCSNPTLVRSEHVNLNKYTFNYNTNDYYAEYIFKEGFLAKGFIVHKYTGINSYKFQKENNCEAPILGLFINDLSPVQGENVNISVRVGSAFNGADAGTPNYRPSEYTDFFDSDTNVVLELVQNNTVVRTLTQETSVFMNEDNELTFVLNTSGLSGDYVVRVKTNVTDNLCNQANSVEDEQNTNLFVETSVPLVNPVANAGSDRNVCINTNVVFDGSSSYDTDGNIVSYTWNFGDSNTALGSIVNHVYNQLGNYNVVLTVRDDDNLQSQDNLVVTVNNCTISNQNPVANAGNDKTANINHNLIFDGSSSYDTDGNIVSYTWNFGDGTNATGSIVNHVYNQLGNYNVVLTVRDDDNAVSTDNLVVHIINNTVIPLTLDIDANPDEGDAPLNVTFNSTVSGSNPFIYYWNFDDGSHSHAADPVHLFDEEGIYHVTLNVTDVYNNTITDSITIEVDDDNTNNDEDEYITSNGGDRHKLTIGNVLVSEEFYPNDLVEINAELINNGNYKEDYVTFNALITELGVSSTPKTMTLAKGTTSWGLLQLELPENIQPGLYSIKLTLGNNYYVDTVYKVITIKDDSNLRVLLGQDNENEIDYLAIIEIVFISLLILLAALGILLLAREIKRIQAV